MIAVAGEVPNVTRDGTDPIQLERVAAQYGLSVKPYRDMTPKQLRKCLDRERPVVLMIQAWDEGHWVIAIGYDRDGFYFEDPWLQTSRGFIANAELEARWHDVEGADNQRTDRYGVAIWGKRRYARRATIIRATASDA